VTRRQDDALAVVWLDEDGSIWRIADLLAQLRAIDNDPERWEI
jgi:hypothetical protein